MTSTSTRLARLHIITIIIIIAMIEFHAVFDAFVLIFHVF